MAHMGGLYWGPRILGNYHTPESRVGSPCGLPCAWQITLLPLQSPTSSAIYQNLVTIWDKSIFYVLKGTIIFHAPKKHAGL